MERPILTIPRTTIVLILNFLAVAGVIASFALALHAWRILPDRIPHHYNLRGEADAWGGKWIVFFLPSIAAVMLMGLFVLSRFPHKFNYLQTITAENAFRQYRAVLSMLAWLRLEIAWLFVYILWEMMQGGLDESRRMSPWFLPISLSVFLGTVFIHLMMGHRSPQSLSSSRSL